MERVDSGWLRVESAVGAGVSAWSRAGLGVTRRARRLRRGGGARVRGAALWGSGRRQKFCFRSIPAISGHFRSLLKKIYGTDLKPFPSFPRDSQRFPEIPKVSQGFPRFPNTFEKKITTD